MPPAVPSDPAPGIAPAPGAEERHLASGTIAQQVATAIGVVVMLVVVTALGRSLSLAEFGLYGLALSIVGYMLVLQYAVEGAAIRAIAGAPEPERRDAIFTTAIVLYAGLGLVAGAFVAAGGTAVVGVLGIPDSLRDEARQGFLALGAVIAVGWPFRACQDALRGTRRFLLSAAGELAGYTLFGALMIAMLVADAPLWALIGIGGSISVLIGVACAIALVLGAEGPHPRPGLVDRAGIRELLRVSGGLVVLGATDLVVYSSDRIILAAFRSAATVGLYEAAVRAHNLLRQLAGTLVLTVTPAASGYLAAGDELRLRALLLRGTRYVLAIVVPATIVLMVLSAPLLEVWLGERFRPAAPALSIMCSYWLTASGLSVAASMLIAAGRFRQLTAYGWTVAAINLALSLALTPLLGLEGVVLGTTIAYFVTFPYLMRLTLATFPAVTAADLLREAWLPAFSGGAVLAGLLLALRLTVDLDSVAAVAAAGSAGLALYWGAYYLVWLVPEERLLVASYLRRAKR